MEEFEDTALTVAGVQEEREPMGVSVTPSQTGLEVGVEARGETGKLICYIIRRNRTCY